MRIEYSRRALQQLASIFEYLAGRSPAAAQSVRTSVRSTIARLEELPLLGKLTDEADVHVLIEPEYLYRVFYRVEEERVTVIRILHRSQRRAGKVRWDRAPLTSRESRVFAAGAICSAPARSRLNCIGDHAHRVQCHARAAEARRPREKARGGELRRKASKPIAGRAGKGPAIEERERSAYM
jgi:toxin ParE1/3/4